MSKKINAGDTLTVGDLTDDYLGAVIEVGPVEGLITRMRLEDIKDRDGKLVAMLTVERGIKYAHPDETVTVITPPPVVQPDEPTELGQCISIEGSEWWGVVVAPGTSDPILRFGGDRWSWIEVLEVFDDRRIIVSDPPRWPDETPVVPERIERSDWPADDEHLRGWEWIDADGDVWRWEDRGNRKPGWNWNSRLTPLSSPIFGPWTRGERIK